MIGIGKVVFMIKQSKQLNANMSTFNDWIPLLSFFSFQSNLKVASLKTFHSKTAFPAPTKTPGRVLVSVWRPTWAWPAPPPCSWSSARSTPFSRWIDNFVWPTRLGNGLDAGSGLSSDWRSSRLQINFVEMKSPSVLPRFWDQFNEIL